VKIGEIAVATDNLFTAPSLDQKPSKKTAIKPKQGQVHQYYNHNNRHSSTTIWPLDYIAMEMEYLYLSEQLLGL